MQRNKGKRQGTTQSRVARGVKYLDKRIPDWWTQIDVERLDMWSGCKCVLGQLYDSESGRCTNGYYQLVDVDNVGVDRKLLQVKARGLTRLANLVMPVVTAKRLGFCVTNFNNHWSDWDQLTAEWKRVIQEKRYLARA